MKIDARCRELPLGGALGHSDRPQRHLYDTDHNLIADQKTLG
jgi:hypothetical protein